MQAAARFRWESFSVTQALHDKAQHQGVLTFRLQMLCSVTILLWTCVISTVKRCGCGCAEQHPGVDLRAQVSAGADHNPGHVSNMDVRA